MAMRLKYYCQSHLIFINLFDKQRNKGRREGGREGNKMKSNRLWQRFIVTVIGSKLFSMFVVCGPKT
jgi:hypothetical protein